MLFKFKLLLFILALFTFIPGISGGQTLPFTHYTPDNELNPIPSAEVLQVYQDSEGFMWFAVYSSGIVRYDGSRMVTYGLDDGLTNLTVWDMTEDATGRLWVSSNGGVVVSKRPLAEYKNGARIEFTQTVNEQQLVNVVVNHNRMTLDHNGWLWIGTESSGLIRYRYSDDDSFESDTLSTSTELNEPGLPVRSLTVRNDGSVWVALLDGHILRYENGIVTNRFNTGTERITSTLFESPDGTLWGGERSGHLWRLNEENGITEFQYFENQYNNNISDITYSSEGSLWLSTEGSGLFRINPDSGKPTANYARSNGLLGEITFNVIEDRENNIWIAQSGGVSKLRYNYKAFRNLTSTSIAGEKPALPSNSVNSVLPSSQQNHLCAIWAGTSEGGISCINSEFESEYIQSDQGLTGNWVNGLVYDQSGRLWIGTSRGLNSLSFPGSEPLSEATVNSEVSIFDINSTLSTYPAASVLAAEKLFMRDNPRSQATLESLWFPAYRAVYAVINDKLFTLAEENNLPAAIFHAVAFDDEGYLYVGTRDRGIYRTTEPVSYQDLSVNGSAGQPSIQFEPWWSADLGAPSNQIEKMLWHNGLMWIGTPSGLVALEGGTTSINHFITEDEGLPANNATSFAVSPLTETLWVGTNNGLAEIDPATGSVLKTVSKVDGLVDNEVWFYGSVQFDPDGVLHFGSAKGIAIYNPTLDKPNSVSPTLKLRNFISNEIDGEHNEFTFEYSALSFGNEKLVRYQTRLVGFNTDWTPIKTDTRVNYTNLSAVFLPKTYRFEVRAYNESGVPSTGELAFEFQVAPPPLLSWWAFLIYFVVLSAGVFVVDRIQRARLIKKERNTAHLRETELKAEAAEAQAKALQAENELKAAELEKAKELEIAYHELKSTQKRLIQAEKMASLGRLSTGIAHEIKNPLNFINNFSEVSRELVDELKTAIHESDQEEIEYILKNLSFNTQKIDEHGKRADSIVRSMMQHSRGGEGDFETVNLNQLIKEYVELAYHGKKSKIKDLDVNIRTDLDSSVSNIEIIPQKVGQVMQNLIENAIDSVWSQKHNSNGEYHPEILISSTSSNGHVEVKISDNGPGIPEHIRERIFEPFFTTKPTGEGTGLGLSLSYDFITQIHNGKLELAESELGGAAFVISLPHPSE